MERIAVVLSVVLAASPAVAQTKPKKPAAPAKPTPAAAAPAGTDPLQALLDKKALAGAYNPVLLDFLVEEGEKKVPAAQRRAALDQQVAGFREQATITKGEQATAGLATALGAILGGQTGGAIEDAAFQSWSEWVDAAFVLHKAGYPAEAASFFENCLQVYPYDALKARCAQRLAATKPDQAIGILTGLLKDTSPIETQNMALRLLGGLAAAEGLPAEKKAAIVDDLVKRTKGMLNGVLFEAAVDGLALAKDPRAVEPLRGLTKGIAKGDEVKRAAKRALLIAYDDAGAREALKKDLKGGFMAQPENQVFAATTLIEAGDPAGFDWAREYLSKKKKDPDYSSDVVHALVLKGGEPAKAVLAAAIAARKPNEWITAAMAVGLLQLGDASQVGIVKAALANKDWPNLRLSAAVALGAQKDYSGVPVLQAMAADPGMFKKALDLLRGSAPSDPDAVKSAVASALGRIDHAEAVPPLVTLLGDASMRVRLSAAYALAGMTDAAALDGLALALDTDFGQEQGKPRTPLVHAHVVRTTASRFAADARGAALVKKACDSPSPTVRFLALAESAGRR
jgi:HEAT repeat protein